jgi:nucleoside 2-deoxyribosyltransferase
MQPHQNPCRVYCAGPLFNPAERRQMVEIAEALAREGFEPWVPHRDGMEFAEVHPYLIDQGFDAGTIGQLIHEAVFALDVYQVVLGCGALVANLNGRVPDEGTVSETAMAYMLGKPIVLFHEDVRSMISGRHNPLVVGLTGFQTTSELDQLGPALRAKIAELAPRADQVYPCPPHLALPLGRGEKLWAELVKMGEERPTAAVSETILELFLSSAESAPVK